MKLISKCCLLMSFFHRWWEKMRFNDIMKTKTCYTARKTSIQFLMKKNSTRNSRITIRNQNFINIRAARRKWLTKKKTAENCILKSKKNFTRKDIKTEKKIRTRNLSIWQQKIQLFHSRQNSIFSLYLCYRLSQHLIFTWSLA